MKFQSAGTGRQVEEVRFWGARHAEETEEHGAMEKIRRAADTKGRIGLNRQASSRSVVLAMAVVWQGPRSVWVDLNLKGLKNTGGLNVSRKV